VTQDALGIPGATSPGTAEIRHGDAFDLVADLVEDTVDLVLTSPPFWGLRSYGLSHEEGTLQRWESDGCSPTRAPPYDWYREAGGLLGLEPYPEWYTAHLVEFFNRCRRVLKGSGSLWVNLGDTYFARWGSIRDGGRQGMNGGRRRRRTPSGGYLQEKQLLMIPARFAIAMQDAGWILRNDLIWSKPNVMPRPEADRLRLSHEHWFHFVQRQPGRRPRYYYDLEACEDGARDVVECFTAAGANGHSATFPPALIRPRIASACPPGGLVLDPFCGTGRAVIEAACMSRSGIGFDLSEDYVIAAQDDISRLVRERADTDTSERAPCATTESKRPT